MKNPLSWRVFNMWFYYGCGAERLDGAVDRLYTFTERSYPVPERLHAVTERSYPVIERFHAVTERLYPVIERFHW